MDSRCSKDSNGILFVIFGLTDRKIWFFKDLDEIWFEKPIWILFWFRQGHVALWYSLVPLRVDQELRPLDLKGFGWIRSSHTGSVSDLIWGVGSRSDGSEKIWERSSPRVRSPATGGEVAALGVNGEMLRWSLDYGETTTSFRTMRWTWELDRRPRLLAEGGEGYGRRSFGRRWFSAVDACVVWLQNRRSWGLEEVCHDEAKWVQKMGRSRAYRRRRNRPDGLADATVSDDESRQPGGVEWEGKEGGRGRRSRGFIGRSRASI
jgi:hypothetical protein